MHPVLNRSSPGTWMWCLFWYFGSGGWCDRTWLLCLRQVSPRYRLHGLKSKSCSLSNAHWHRKHGMVCVFSLPSNTNIYFSWTFTAKRKKEKEKEKKIESTYTAIMHIQCPFKFKPLDKFSSPCEKRENNCEKMPSLFVYFCLSALCSLLKRNISSVVIKYHIVHML